jgi:alkaline phosphatase
MIDISKPLLWSLLISISPSPLFSAELTAERKHKAEHDSPNNIIIVIADGMGPAYTTAYRLYKDNLSTPRIEPTVFDRHLIGRVSTHPAQASGYVTDSASAATALFTGIKTVNGAVGVDTENKALESIADRAITKGKKIGVVVTSQVYHATPAAFLSHNTHRSNYAEIADSFIDKGIKVDLLLGGGQKKFIREDRNLVTEFQQAGFHYIDNYRQLKSLPSNKPVLGLFSNSGLPGALDDANKYRLSTMTKAAMKHLDNAQYINKRGHHNINKGSLVLIEASQIDWAGHNNDIAMAMTEVDDLAKTVIYLESYVKNNPSSLVILTADHSTGGLSLGANGDYIWQPDMIRQLTLSTKHIATTLYTSSITGKLCETLFKTKLTSSEIDKLREDKSRFIDKRAKNDKVNKGKSYKAAPLYKSVVEIINNRTNTGWTTTGHSAVDVPLFAFGRQSHLFQGQLDNTDIAQIIFTLLEQ